MKKFDIQFLFVFFIIFIIGCKSNYIINNESKPIPPLNKYTKIHVGWLDLNEKDWSFHGYGNVQEWKKEIYDMNISGLFKYIMELLPDRKYSFATSNTDNNINDIDLSIQFSDIGIENYKRLPYRPGHVDLSTKIHFIDIKTGKVIYSVSLTTYGYNGWGWNFEERLNDAIYYLAYFITDKLY